MEFSPSPQKLVLTLNIESSGHYMVRACEVLGKGVRNRLSFTTDKPMQDVFQKEFARKLDDCLGSIEQEIGVVSLPDFRLHIHGFAVAGLHLLISRISENCRQVICRFRHFLGGIDAALKSGSSSAPPVATYQEKMALETICEISLPLLNLCELDTLAKDGDINLVATKAYLERLSEKRHELEFYTEMLKRYVEGSAMVDAPREDAKHIEDVQPPTAESLEYCAVAGY